MRRLLFLAPLLASCATPEKVERPEPPQLEGDRPAIGRKLDLELPADGGEAVRLRGVTGRVTVVCVLGGNGNGAGEKGTKPGDAKQEPPHTGGAGEQPLEVIPASALRQEVGPASPFDPSNSVPPGEKEEDKKLKDPTLPEPPPPEGAEEAQAEPLPTDEVPGGAKTARDTCAGLAERWQDRITVVGLVTDPAIEQTQVPFRIYRDPKGAALQEDLELSPVSQILLVDNQGRVARVLPPGGGDDLDGSVERLVF